MPTPSSNPPPELPPRSHSSSCPDELRASTSSWRPDNDGLEEMHVDSDSSSPEPVSAVAESSTAMAEDVDVDAVSRSNTESPRPDSRSGDASRPISEDPDVDGPSQASSKTMETDHAVTPGDDRPKVRNASDRGSSAFDMISPVSADNDKTDDMASSNSRLQDDYSTPSMGYEYSNVRLIPTTSSSYLRPGSKFHGTQQSERQIYDVQVEVKYVDLRESSLCGYLRIQVWVRECDTRLISMVLGLTEDNPTLTTFFEGEIIGSKYGFITNHPDWGATDKIDVSHWNKFTAFRPYAKTVRKGGNVAIPHLGSKENIFMRWKERFLVPDHRVRTINGASFEGFYYICFNQKSGTVSGIYFHAKSEK
ncbi:vacuolar import and degradation protein [Seiridium cupressi]